MIKFTAEVEPVSFKRTLANGKRRFNDRRYSDFKDVLAHIAKIFVRAPLKGNIKISVDFFKLKPKKITSRLWGDLDNHLKAVLDALNGIAYLDDCQVVQISGSKNFGEAKIVITLEAVE